MFTLYCLLLLQFVTGGALGSFIELSIINSQTRVPIQLLENGDNLDLSLIGDDLTIVATTTEHVDSVRFILDSNKIIIERISPYTFDFMKLDEKDRDTRAGILSPGLRNLTVFTLNTIGDVIDIRTVMFTMSPLGGIVGFSLVDTVRNEEIIPLLNGDTIDVSLFGNALSVRIHAYSTVSLVEFVIDDVVMTDNERPFSLGGDSLFDFQRVYFPWASLSFPGVHSLTATAFDIDGVVINSISISFKAMKSKVQNFYQNEVFIKGNMNANGSTFIIEGYSRQWFDDNIEPESSGVYDEKLFEGHRWGPRFTYFIENFEPDSWFLITIGFSENYSKNCRIGGRVMNIELNGDLILTGLDIYEKAGCNIGHLEQKEVKTSGKGRMDISFIGIVDYAMVSFIEIKQRSNSTQTREPAMLVGTGLPIKQPSISPSESFSAIPMLLPDSLTVMPMSLPDSLTAMPMSLPDSLTAMPMSLTTKPMSLPENVNTIWGAYNHSPMGALSGEMLKWHKVTLGFEGPQTSEISNPNPFTFYRLDVAFAHPESGKVYSVPGYYAADGNAANTGATSGNVWLVHFTPDETGIWNWQAMFKAGKFASQNGSGMSAGYFDNTSGIFDIYPSDKTGRDHRAKGRLQYIGEHHLRFKEAEEWFLKVGVDSPENFLSYDDFDNTPNYHGYRKSWNPHKIDHKDGDPVWAGDRGTGMIGALNYLSQKGLNAVSFLTMNIQGDDKNVFPYISDSPTDFQRIDVSKTAQWEIVFEHADRLGMYLHFKTQEHENDQLLDGGDLGLDRKLYYRELIARFSHHLALTWNLGEENTNTNRARLKFADYFHFTDPYQHLITIHTSPYLKDEIYGQLLGYQSFSGVSMQCSPITGLSDTLEWVKRSSDSGQKWVVTIDEQNPAGVGVAPDSVDILHNIIRSNILWANLIAGGGGVEYYFGYNYDNSDLNCEDFRTREAMWDQSRYALEFFSNNNVSFWTMTNANHLVSVDNWCMKSTNADSIVVYAQSSVVLIDIDQVYKIKWYDPLLGGRLQDGSMSIVTPGQSQSLGDPPNIGTDWVVLLRCIECSN